MPFFTCVLLQSESHLLNILGHVGRNGISATENLTQLDILIGLWLVSGDLTNRLTIADNFFAHLNPFGLQSYNESLHLALWHR